MTIADSITLIEGLLDKGDLAEAKKKVDQLYLEVGTPSFKVLILKAQVSLRSKQYEECQAVASQAAELAYSNGKRSKISEALKLLAMAFFRSKDYDNALKYITYSSSFDDSQNPEIKMFANMVAQKYKKTHDISDELLEQERQKILSIPLTFSTSEPEKKATTSSSAAAAAAAVASASSPSTNAQGKAVNQKLRSDWFDSGKTVEISLYVKKIDADTVKAVILSDSIEFEFQDAYKHSYQYKVDRLSSSIDETESTYKVYGTKLQIVLVKKSSKAWHSLEKLESDRSFEGNAGEEETETQETALPETKSSLSYPSSSNKKIDWSKFDIDDEKEEEEDPDAFFKKLYENADEDARRAMMKSFMESNGTSLSTDWKDVGSREVKPYEEESEKKSSGN
ncbi:hypothetical protein PMKS-000999 [Pichia membranifaciens]|uniref:CS domain-containing protein n=1 Tax=Pichia membranifaciens TaxID=4926 RepID=A0A1Q2YDF0_9ASCO|nr:hypothetical protein PMKS-000999 [Pichia membranifaciens]